MGTKINAITLIKLDRIFQQKTKKKNPKKNQKQKQNKNKKNKTKKKPLKTTHNKPFHPKKKDFPKYFVNENQDPILDIEIDIV